MNPFKRLFGNSGGEDDDGPLTHLEELYLQHFGEISSVFHELEDRGNHVDVYRFNPRGERTLTTYISGGMSRRDQPEAGELARVELMIYAAQHFEELPNAIRLFAHYPWETGAAFLGWDLLPLGEHAEAMLGPGSGRYGGILVCPSTRNQDRDLAMAMRSLTPMVSPLNLIPLLADEFDYASNVGIKELIDRVSASSHSVTFDPSRESVLSDT